MSVLDRLNRLVRANLNHVASRAAGRQLLVDVRDTLREARAQLVESRTAEKRLSEEYESLLDDAQAWEDRAVLALRANDERLARKALERKYRVDQRARAAKQDLDDHRAQATDLMRSLDAIEVKLEGMRDRRRAARRSAEAERTAPAAGPTPREPTPTPLAPPPRWARAEAGAELGTLGDGTTFDAFDEMSDRLTRAEVELDAIRELSGPSGLRDPLEDNLEARFRELETGRDLDRLKRRTGSIDDLRRRLDEE